MMQPGESNCPRCRLPLPREPVDWPRYQIEHCPFCAERWRQMTQNRGRATLAEPTADYPTWGFDGATR